jgi:hypothetical protein
MEAHIMPDFNGSTLAVWARGPNDVAFGVRHVPKKTPRFSMRLKFRQRVGQDARSAVSSENLKVSKVGLFMIPELVRSCMSGKVRMGNTVFYMNSRLDGKRPEPGGEICVKQHGACHTGKGLIGPLGNAVLSWGIRDSLLICDAM